jgi:hypothetical protein
MDIAETTDPGPKVCYSSAKQAVVRIYYVTLLILHEFHITLVQQSRKNSRKNLRRSRDTSTPAPAGSGVSATTFSVHLALPEIFDMPAIHTKMWRNLR